MADGIINRLLPFIHDEMRMPAGMIKDVIEEIERLRVECDRWHDVANSLASHIEKTSLGNARALQEYDNMVYRRFTVTDDTVINMNFNLGKDQTVDDIVTRLRAYDIGSVAHESEHHMTEVLSEAAEEIERLRTEVARLNTFLHPIGVVINQAVRGE